MQDKKYYVIVLHSKDKKLYFQYEKVGTLNPKTLEPMSEAEGIFTENINDAKKFKDLFTAQFFASAYPLCEIEEVNIMGVRGC